MTKRIIGSTKARPSKMRQRKEIRRHQPKPRTKNRRGRSRG